MDRIVTPDEAAELLQVKGNPKHKGNVIRKQCADGTIRNAEKVGSKWYINATREWPHLFGEVDPPDVLAKPAAQGAPGISLDTTLGELLQLIGTAMATSMTSKEIG